LVQNKNQTNSRRLNLHSTRTLPLRGTILDQRLDFPSLTLRQRRLTSFVRPLVIKKPNSQFKAFHASRLTSLEGLPLASFKARAGALIFDFLLVLVLVILIGLPAALKNRDASGHVVVHFDPFHSVLGLLALVSYFGLATYFGHGQTLGKRIFRIRVISLAHNHLSLWHCVERALGYGASALEGGFGFVQYFLHPNRQTVHDRIAETIVISSKTSAGPNA